MPILREDAMTGPNIHPVVSAFDNLIALREYVAGNPNDGAAQFVAYCATNFRHSCSQLFQDLFVVFCLKGKRNGFFVEFGAANGIELSNTVVLERNFEWRGILGEPARCWHAELKSNRRATIDTRCLWSESGRQLEFREVERRDFSTLNAFADKDFHRDERRKGITYPVDTISLNDLLHQHNAPSVIDYLSVDTEGSELEILRAFDFAKYDVKIMTVEHNFQEPVRQHLNALMMANGFIRLFEAFSKFDDWYVKRSLVGR
jgi:FkbM family methyltransferase